VTGNRLEQARKIYEQLRSMPQGKCCRLTLLHGLRGGSRRRLDCISVKCVMREVINPFVIYIYVRHFVCVCVCVCACMYVSL